MSIACASLQSSNSKFQSRIQAIAAFSLTFGGSREVILPGSPPLVNVDPTSGNFSPPSTPGSVSPRRLSRQSSSAVITPPLSLSSVGSSRRSSILETPLSTQPPPSPVLPDPVHPLLATINVIQDRKQGCIEQSDVFSDAKSLAKLLRFQGGGHEHSSGLEMRKRKLFSKIRARSSSRSNSQEKTVSESFHALLHNNTLVLYSGLVDNSSTHGSHSFFGTPFYGDSSPSLQKFTRQTVLNTSSHTYVVSYSSPCAPSHPNESSRFLVHFPAHATTYEHESTKNTGLHFLPVTSRIRQLANSHDFDCRSTPYEAVPLNSLVYATTDDDDSSKAKALDEMVFSGVEQLLSVPGPTFFPSASSFFSPKDQPKLSHIDQLETHYHQPLSLDEALSYIQPVLTELREALLGVGGSGAKVVLQKDNRGNTDLMLIEAEQDIESIRAELERASSYGPNEC